MTKKQTQPPSPITAQKLVIIAVLVGVANIIISYLIGTSQADVCPKSHGGGFLSALMSLVSIGLALGATILAKNKPSAIVMFIGWTVLVLYVGTMLYFVAEGGLDWCNFLRS